MIDIGPPVFHCTSEAGGAPGQKEKLEGYVGRLLRAKRKDVARPSERLWSVSLAVLC